MIVEKIVVGALETNCYIIAPSANSEAVIIDPGGDAHLILQRLEKLNLRPILIINTHGHIDHTGADNKLAVMYNIPIYISVDDASVLNDPTDNLSLLLGEKYEEVRDIKQLKDGQALNLGGLELKVLSTPGHTKGSVSILTDKKLFSGDLLFRGSVGRTDFPSSSYKELLESLKKISSLPDEVIVYPGHGPSTTIGEEKESNMFFREINY